MAPEIRVFPSIRVNTSVIRYGDILRLGVTGNIKIVIPPHRPIRTPSLSPCRTYHNQRNYISKFNNYNVGWSIFEQRGTNYIQQIETYPKRPSRQLLQNRWPQDVCQGSLKTLLQIGHESRSSNLSTNFT